MGQARRSDDYSPDPEHAEGEESSENLRRKVNLYHMARLQHLYEFISRGENQHSLSKEEFAEARKSLDKSENPPHLPAKTDVTSADNDNDELGAKGDSPN
jgi:hypothetical protein